MSPETKHISHFAFIRQSVILTLLVVLPLSVLSEPKATLSEALIKVRMPLAIADGRLSGAGAQVLTRAVADSRFVLLGEDHVTREIPQFAAALCDVMRPDYYAVEAGPEAARFVTDVLHRPDRITRMSARMQAHPDNMAFLDVRDENDLAVHCATASHNTHFQIWGLDQEFLGASGTLLDAMVATQPGRKARAGIAHAQATDRMDDENARLSGNPGKAFLLASSDADLRELQEAVEADGKPTTRALLHELTISRDIYHLNSSGSPDANRIRAELFKRHFLADYSAAQKQISAPRVLFKFGDNHVAKGFSALHERDLGNFVAEFADGKEAQSLHILVLGARGTHATFAGYAKPFAREPFVMTDDPDYKWLLPAVAALLPQENASNGKTLTLFDLRRLRFEGIDMSSEWERIIFGFDLFVFIPELTPASAIQ